MLKNFMVSFLILVACSWSLFIPGLNAGHDNNHLARVYEMTRALKEGVFPVIWSQNLNFGFGMPIFEFYAPLPYYFGALINVITNDLVLSVKTMIFAANVITLIGISQLSKLVFTKKQSVFITVAATVLAPYRAVDLYVRTAISESWAIAFLPFILWGIIAVIKQKKWGFIIVSASIACLILSHNLTAMMALPILSIFGIMYLGLQPNTFTFKLKVLSKLFIAGLLGIGIAAFYVLPIVQEKSFTQLDKYVLSEYFDYRQHFLYIRQFVKPWGVWEYGGSGWGPNDEMSYFLGVGQLLILAIAVYQLSRATLRLYLRHIPLKPMAKYQVINMVLIFSILLLTLLKMQFLWDIFSFLKYIQFPWRLLSVALVFIGLAGGVVIESIEHTRIRNGLFIALMSLIVGINYRYFRSEKYIDHSQEITHYDSIIRSEISAGLYDYIPSKIDFLTKIGFFVYKDIKVNDLTVPADSLVPVGQYARIIDDLSTYKQVVINQEKPSRINFNIAFYPGWEAKINNIYTEVKPNHHGLIYLDVAAGENTIELSLKDTPIRHMGKIISGICMVIFSVMIISSHPKSLSKSNQVYH